MPLKLCLICAGYDLGDSFLFFLSLLDLPVGCEQGTVALYRTEGPFLHSISLSASPDRVQAGKTFVVKVSGNLAGRPNQPTGQFLLLLHRKHNSGICTELGSF